MTLRSFVIALILCAAVYLPFAAALLLEGYLIPAGFVWAVFAVHFFYVLSRMKGKTRD